MRRQYILYGHGFCIDGVYRVEIIPDIVCSDSDRMETVRDTGNGEQYFDYGEYEPLFFYKTEYFSVSNSEVAIRLCADITVGFLDPIVVWNWWVEKFLKN